MMPKKSTQTILLIGLAGISLLIWLLARHSSGVSGFPLDDGWIHQTYARSLANGQGWTFIPGVPSAGATAPLWVLLLVPGYWIGASPFGWIAVLGLIQLAAVGLLAATAWQLMGLGQGRWPLAAGGVLILEWHLVWAALSGMETLLYGLLSLAVITGLLWLSKKPVSHLWLWFGLGALIGLGVWVRPEAVTLLGPVGMAVLLLPEADISSRVKKLAAAGAGFLLLFGAYLLFNRWLAGTWWPNTFYAKQAEYQALQSIPFAKRVLQQFTPLMAGALAALLPGLAGSIYYSVKRKTWIPLAAAIWAFGHVVMYAWRLPVSYQHGRYVIPALPLLVLLGLAGYAQILAGVKADRSRWLLSRAWGGAVLCILGLFWLLGLQSYLKDVAMIDGEMVRTAVWLQEHTSQDDLIAAHDIGAIGYFTQRPILDLAGLISPDVIPFIRDENQLADYLNRACPRYLVTFPDWYVVLPEMGELVYQTDSQITLEQGGTNMAVYRWVGNSRCP